MCEPLDLKIEDGELIIQQAEMTSQGVEKDGLAALDTDFICKEYKDMLNCKKMNRKKEE